MLDNNASRFNTVVEHRVELLRKFLLSPDIQDNKAKQQYENIRKVIDEIFEIKVALMKLNNFVEVDNDR